MSTPKRPLPASTTSSGATGRRQSSKTRTPSPNGLNASANAPAATVLSSNGMARNTPMRSPSGVARPNRASVRRPQSIVGSVGNGSGFGEEQAREDDARIENAALIDNLKKSLRNAELMSEDYQQHLVTTQKALDDLSREHAKLEERLHESLEKVEDMETMRKEESRQVRNMASLYESERTSMLRDREDASVREKELRATIQRLKETVAGREMRFNVATDLDRRRSRAERSHSRSSSVDEHSQFAPPSSMQRRGSSANRSESHGNSRLAMQKDNLIESLKLELADAQIKVVEMENMGGDRMQELERTLLETRMTNARLMEDNESFQLLLGEKTLNGDFAKTEFMQETASGGSRLGSLAEELENAEGESENYRRLEAETKSLRDQNKALTLYVEKIISRVLQHDNFETILDQKPNGSAEDARPPPPAKQEAPAPSVLQRAMSVVGSRRQRPSSQLISSSPSQQEDQLTARRSRPQSQVISQLPDHVQTANEDPARAPSISLGRTQSRSGRSHPSHRLTESQKSIDMPTAATVVNQMYRAPSTGSQGPISPVSPGSTTTRSTYFASSAFSNNASNSNSSVPPRPSSSQRTASAMMRSSSAQHGPTNSSGGSTRSRDSIGGGGEASSPPRNNAGNTVYTGAVMTQSKLRPLRLVQEKETAQARVASEEEAARKRANRGSWMGWFNKGKDEPTPRTVSAGQVQEQGAFGRGNMF